MDGAWPPPAESLLPRSRVDVVQAEVRAELLSPPSSCAHVQVALYLG